jgi:signal peptidase I
MIPTLEVGDHIFVSKFAYAIGIPFTNAKIAELGKPKRGDIIVFKYPPDQSIDYIKRVMGLPGETLEVRHNEVFIDGRPMAREQLPSRAWRARTARTSTATTTATPARCGWSTWRPSRT